MCRICLSVYISVSVCLSFTHWQTDTDTYILRVSLSLWGHSLSPFHFHFVIVLLSHSDFCNLVSLHSLPIFLSFHPLCAFPFLLILLFLSSLLIFLSIVFSQLQCFVLPPQKTITTTVISNVSNDLVCFVSSFLLSPTFSIFKLTYCTFLIASSVFLPLSSSVFFILIFFTLCFSTTAVQPTLLPVLQSSLHLSFYLFTFLHFSHFPSACCIHTYFCKEIIFFSFCLYSKSRQNSEWRMECVNVSVLPAFKHVTKCIYTLSQSGCLHSILMLLFPVSFLCRYRGWVLGRHGGGDNDNVRTLPC